MRIVVLAGGIGGARFLRGLKQAAPDADITVIGNTGDDIHLFGLRVCPDLDTVMYTLGGGINEEQGWGRAQEAFRVKEELAAYGVGPEWFGLGDRDFATHIVRTQMLGAGYPLSAVTEALCDRWQPGVRLIPMTDDRVETHVAVTLPPEAGQEDGPAAGAARGGDAAPQEGAAREEDTVRGQGAVRGDGSAPAGEQRAIHFQEYWVRLRASVPAQAVVPVGADQAKPAPGVLDALAEADTVLFPPSNPVVSVGPILAVPGIREAIADAGVPVVGLSPIVGGSPVRGMADKVLAAIGVESTAAAVAEHYGSGLLDGWLVDTVDAEAVPRVTAAGIRCRAVPLMMTDVDAATRMAREALDLAEEVRP